MTDAEQIAKRKWEKKESVFPKGLRVEWEAVHPSFRAAMIQAEMSRRKRTNHNGA